MLLMFLGSSVVEQTAVNRSVAGSSPARGASTYNLLFLAVYQTGKPNYNQGFRLLIVSSKHINTLIDKKIKYVYSMY